MPTYFYKARTLSGEVQDGKLQVSSQAEAASILQKQGLFVTLISDKPFDKETIIKKEGAGKALKKEVVFFGHISDEEKMVFSVQLANMVNAGLPLLRSLYIILEQLKNPKFHSVLQGVYHEVEGGTSFCDALEKYPKVFPPYFTSSVRAGEATGQLGKVLERVAAFAEHDMEVKQNIQAAMTYPIILIVVGAGVICFIITGVIPSFVSTFLRIGIELPLPTLIMYDISIILKKQWFFVFLGVWACIYFVRAYIATPIGRLWLDRTKLNLPFMGQMVERFSLSRFSRTLGMLLGCGVSVLSSLKIVQRNVDNEVYSRAIDIVYKKVEQGARIGDSLKEAKVFPLDLVQLVTVGEETGRIADLLNRVGDYYDTTSKYSIKKFMAMIEPVFLLVLGCIIAFIMAAVLLPIFDMMKLTRQA